MLGVGAGGPTGRGRARIGVAASAVQPLRKSQRPPAALSRLGIAAPAWPEGAWADMEGAGRQSANGRRRPKRRDFPPRGSSTCTTRSSGFIGCRSHGAHGSPSLTGQVERHVPRSRPFPLLLLHMAQANATPAESSHRRAFVGGRKPGALTGGDVLPTFRRRVAICRR